MSTKTICVQGVEVDVQYTYYPPCRGARERSGLPLSPDEPASIEIEYIRIGEQDITDIVNMRFGEAVEEELMQQIADDIQADEAAYADAMYDEWKERNRYEMP